MAVEARALIREVYESRIQQREAEIRALQSQINPHFLYNTLSAINWKAIRAGNQEVSRVAVALSRFYRATLNQGRFTTTVGAEIETVQSYLEVQRFIHDDSFDVELETEAEALAWQMPNVILQPLVENAIQHGVDMKEDGGRGKIRIQARMRGRAVLFTIRDNGPGLAESLGRKILLGEGTGCGVKNVNDRLRFFFGPEYGLVFRQAPGGGTAGGGTDTGCREAAGYRYAAGLTPQRFICRTGQSALPYTPASAPKNRV
jgi:two-component system sensor histidine kinase YesM